jgi:hypothetical protein
MLWATHTLYILLVCYVHTDITYSYRYYVFLVRLYAFCQRMRMEYLYRQGTSEKNYSQSECTSVFQAEGIKFLFFFLAILLTSGIQQNGTYALLWTNGNPEPTSR